MQYYATISDYCNAINIPRPKHPHFDIRSFADNMSTVIHQMPPFRHAFYAIAVKLEGEGKVITGSQTDFPSGTIIFFNSPFQILSWDIAPDWQGYYIMFSQDFLAKSSYFNNLLEVFPFLKMDTAVPFEVDKGEVKVLINVYKKINEAYHSSHNDKFNFIEIYTLLLLNYVKRYFNRQFDWSLASKVIRNADTKLTSRYKLLIETQFRTPPKIKNPRLLHSTRHYAERLHVHPNHLNAVVKGITGRTALQLIHQHIIQLAKSRLTQTTLSAKEIAFDLYFDAPNNFSSFFKKHTGLTPIAYRKESNL